MRLPALRIGKWWWTENCRRLSPNDFDQNPVGFGQHGTWWGISRLSRIYFAFRVSVSSEGRVSRLDLDYSIRTISNRYVSVTYRHFPKAFYNCPRNYCYLGWAMAPEERDWKYRLSIYYAKRQDSGTFTCATPRGITNSITVYVKC